ncbi:sialic acid TRAP transporter substrate-binding protein SiaP [Ruixingdingia sedimenti]|uniref:Sialic acid TRAP transporter substrate-binding protein SiaP n=1 Tax=Ruixingdingia sedimenti TaxID=3073604 RepID=A0ABU1F997_9RHOB|nr:sialic acid TRAP transporter substrate-binding protein SiaP [Xinfangfangia sp. LG-4]MDR5653158.1 sialic acid TRAP transporter substrate-binding protein SiaP [Xinfangfangia sp. LG-4]
MLTRRIFGTTIAAALAGLALAAPAQAQTTLKWAHIFEVSEPFHTEALWAAGEIARRTGGRYKIDVYPAAQLGNEVSLDQGLTLGTVDMVILTNGFAANKYPPIGVTYYPFTFRDAAHLLKYTESEVYRKLTGGYTEATGHQILATTYYGTRHTTANKPVEKCSDLTGVKMRVPSIPTYMAMPTACGANTTPVPFAELYLALQNGTVDAQENPLPSIEAKKLDEVQTHIALTGHIVDQLNIVIAGGTWKKIDEADRAVFTEVAHEAAQRASQIILDREAKLLDVFRDRGVTILEVDLPSFQNTVLEKVKFEDFGYDKADWEAIRAVQ